MNETPNFQNIQISIELSAYRLSAIKKAVYALMPRLPSVLKEVGEKYVLISGTIKDPSLTQDDAKNMFFKELIDQELREHIYEQTKDVRDLILSHAFSNIQVNVMEGD